MENLSGKVFLITGATDGIGKLTALELAKREATVYIHGRSPERIETTIEEIKESTGNNNIKGYQADFASFSEIRILAEKVLSTPGSLDVLINNAGMGGGEQGNNERTLSQDGFEICFQVNYLSTFLLTHLLLPKLKATPSSKVVNVSSLGQAPIDFNNIMLENDFKELRAYRQSKLAMIMFTIDLAEKLQKEGITVNALHPGSMLNTKIAYGLFGKTFGDAKSGADAIVHLATALELAEVTGKFFDVKRESRALPQAYESDSRTKLWDLSRQWTEVG